MADDALEMATVKRALTGRSSPRRSAVSARLEIILTPTRFFSRVDGLRGMERCGMSSSYPWSVDFGAGELDHLGPLLCICADECAEVCPGQRLRPAEVTQDGRLNRTRRRL